MNITTRTKHKIRGDYRLWWLCHYSGVIISTMVLKSLASRLFTQPFFSVADQRKHQSSASLAFVRGIHRWPVNSTRKGPAARKMFPFDDVIMILFLLPSMTGDMKTTSFVLLRSDLRGWHFVSCCRWQICFFAVYPTACIKRKGGNLTGSIDKTTWWYSWK